MLKTKNYVNILMPDVIYFMFWNQIPYTFYKKTSISFQQKSERLLQDSLKGKKDRLDIEINYAKLSNPSMNVLIIG